VRGGGGKKISTRPSICIENRQDVQCLPDYCLHPIKLLFIHTLCDLIPFIRTTTPLDNSIYINNFFNGSILDPSVNRVTPFLLSVAAALMRRKFIKQEVGPNILGVEVAVGISFIQDRSNVFKIGYMLHFIPDCLLKKLQDGINLYFFLQ
jgi:hypothetical protein